MNKIHLSHLLDMGNVELQNWLVENNVHYVLIDSKSANLIEQQQKRIVEFEDNYEQLAAKAQSRYRQPYEREKKRADELSATVDRLRDPLNKLVSINHTHGGSLGFDGSFLYKVSEDILLSAEAAIKATPQENLAEHDAKIFELATIPKHAKAGCIGEFNFTIENGLCCPQCWHEQDDECDLCHGDSEEGGYSDRLVDVPWDTCKRIWQAMNKIKAEEIRKEYAQRIKDGE